MPGRMKSVWILRGHNGPERDFSAIAIPYNKYYTGTKAGKTNFVPG